MTSLPGATQSTATASFRKKRPLGLLGDPWSSQHLPLPLSQHGKDSAITATRGHLTAQHQLPQAPMKARRCARRALSVKSRWQPVSSDFIVTRACSILRIMHIQIIRFGILFLGHI